MHEQLSMTPTNWKKKGARNQNGDGMDGCVLFSIDTLIRGGCLVSGQSDLHRF